MRIRGLLIVAGLLPTVDTAAADEIQVAVASNFSAAVQALASTFETQAAHTVTLIPGSTGKHYAQIRNGAPFDILLAADDDHPQKLESDGLAVARSRFTYATGALVLWSPTADYVDGQGTVLEEGDFRHLAMANPELAPYGRAARQVLESLGLWTGLGVRMVHGENIGQAFQFVASGNAELGFVALSQITEPGKGLLAGSCWRIPQQLYEPIEQQAVLLTDYDAAREFLEFLRTEDARAIIRRHGYTTPVSTGR